ncbi:MAG TPA: 16S rRNA (guanine(966)-N(2))-methyltransferase RsmD [Blastocatellia bacterium]|nr:16S rRNA (guanine(966)-N(2))-methyltransferase RsmD [Blastocatellia bacterium]
MRIIAGIYRGRRLKTVAGPDVRPTSDRLRETLFNILSPLVPGSVFLDLCAGSGAVGIEALSRGANAATFIERSPKACRVIQENLRSIGLSTEDNVSAALIQAEATRALRRLIDQRQNFDLVFFDPPYESGLYESIMRQLGTGRLLDKKGVVVVEHRAKLDTADQYGVLSRYRELHQGESSLSFYSRS